MQNKPTMVFQLLRRGLTCQESGQLSEAEDLYLQALWLDNTCVDASMLLGLLYLQTKKIVEAEEQFRQVVEQLKSEAGAYLGLAHALREQGRYQESIANYRISINQTAPDQDHAEAHLGLAICYLQTSDFDTALSYINPILEKHPEHDGAYLIRASVFSGLGNHVQALNDYNSALSVNSENCDAWFNRALTLKAMTRDDDAMASLSKALAIDESNANAALEYALLLQKNGRLDDAEELLRRALPKTASDPRIAIALALIAHKLRKFEEAKHLYDVAEKVDSANIEMYMGRGTLHAQHRRLSEALNDFSKARELDPNNRDVQFNLGSIQSVMRKFSDAIKSFECALKIDGLHLPSLLGLAKIFLELRQYDVARQILQKASRIDEKNWETHLQLGFLSRQEKDLFGASKYYESAVHINPEAPFLVGEALFNRLSMCDWSRWDESVETVQKAIVDGKQAIMPFQSLAIFDCPKLQLKCAQIYIESRYAEKENQEIRCSSKKIGNQKITLAYFSSDFYEHATTYLLNDVLEAHNRDLFEIVGYSFGSSPVDPITSRLRSHFDKFFDVSHWGDDEVIRHCRNQGVDIAIDLKGHTFGARPNIFAGRCAPVQINYLGYPGTTGAKYIDYILVDSVLVGPSDYQYYTEVPLLLPRCYQPNCASKDVRGNELVRAEFGLPDDGVIFSSFNNNYKITPFIFDAWMTILKRVPSSVLWLFATSEDCKENLGREAERRGVQRDRLIFADFKPHDEHLERLKLADLFLDTYPCSAHTTASDSLRAGVPVLTLVGRTFASRVAASLLTELSLQEMITKSVDEYVESAVRIASNPMQLQRLKVKVASSIKNSKLFNPRDYVEMYESALIAVLPGRDLLSTQIPLASLDA